MTIIRSEFTPRTFVLYLLHKFLNAKSHIPGALSTCTVGFLNLQTSFLRSLYHHLSKKYSTPMVMVKESNPGRNRLIMGVWVGGYAYCKSEPSDIRGQTFMVSKVSNV